MVMQKKRMKPPISSVASLFLLIYLLFATGRFPYHSSLEGSTQDAHFVAAGVSRRKAPNPADESETIVEIAKSQIGRGPFGVGKDLEHPPYSLSRQLRKNEQWCSEFVSWVYCASGNPLKGGRHGWLMRNSRSLRRWFESNTFFVQREDYFWQNHTPGPGDYIRYHNDRGGHSGLVYSVEDITLVTIEGNIGNRVVVKRLTDWRNRADIDGIGLKTKTSAAIYVEYLNNQRRRRVHGTRATRPRS